MTVAAGKRALAAPQSDCDARPLRRPPTLQYGMDRRGVGERWLAMCADELERFPSAAELVAGLQHQGAANRSVDHAIFVLCGTSAATAFKVRGVLYDQWAAGARATGTTGCAALLWRPS